MVPFRSITEVFGAELEWIEAIKTVKIRVNNTGGETRIELKIGSKTAKYNDQEIELDVPAQVVNGSIMVPLRFVAEAFNAELEWIADEKAIVIRQKIYP
ncbi:MAG: copper amine oxidase N-terminal domain-containing protein [Caldisericia bacterium]